MDDLTLSIITGDITKINADAIVNPTDSSCSGSGGLDLLIHQAAGKGLAEALHSCGKPAVGEAVATAAFELKSARLIIHTAVPKWRSGFDYEEYKLAECYRNSLRLAAEKGCRSVAFPCIGTGTGGFPRDRAAEIAVCTVMNALESAKDAFSGMQVIFVCSEKHTQSYKKQLKKAIIGAFLRYYSPESMPYHFSDKYYSYMKTLAALEWGNMSCHRQYHGAFADTAQADMPGMHSEYDIYARNMDSWDYNSCLAYIIAVFRPPYTYDGTGLVLPHYEQVMNGTIRRVLLRMQSLLG